MQPADTDRIQGAAAIAHRLGSPGRAPTLHISRACPRLAACIAALLHDPRRPEDVRKTDIDEHGHGGDDPYDALRYGNMAAPAPSAPAPASAAPADPIALADSAAW